MQICVWRLVGNISFSQIAFVGEPFSLTTVTRFLRQEGGLGRFVPDLFVVFVWLLKVVWVPRAQATFVRFMGWASRIHPKILLTLQKVRHCSQRKRPTIYFLTTTCNLGNIFDERIENVPQNLYSQATPQT